MAASSWPLGDQSCFMFPKKLSARAEAASDGLLSRYKIFSQLVLHCHIKYPDVDVIQKVDLCDRDDVTTAHAS